MRGSWIEWVENVWVGYWFIGLDFIIFTGSLQLASSIFFSFSFEFTCKVEIQKFDFLVKFVNFMSLKL